MATTTPNLGLTKPTVGADADQWGGQLNASLDTLDAKVLDKTTGGTVSGNLSVTGTVNTPNVNAATTLNLQTGGSTKATIDSAGNLGLGVTPSVWNSQYKAVETSSGSLSGQSGAVLRLMQNAYVNAASNFTYVSTAAASQYVQAGGAHSWHTVGSGTAATQFSFTQAMTLTSGGNLLVGMTTDSGSRIYLRGAIQSANGAGENSYFGEAAGFITGAGVTDSGLRGNGNLLLAAGGATERARITSSGNLLVGTTTDGSARIAAVRNVNDGGNLSLICNFTNGVDQNLAIQNTIGGAADPRVLLNNQNNGAVAFSTNNTERARITSAGYFKASNTGGYFAGGATNTHEFRSNNTDSTVLATRTIDNATEGNYLSIHQTNFANAYHFEGRNNALSVYRVLANGNVQNLNNSYGAISDIKLKENITDATPKLASLNQLRVVNYNLIGSELKQIGLIAQEVEQVFPGLVESTPDVDPETKEPTGTVTKSVKYSVLVPMLLKAVQELSAKVAALEAK